MIEGWDAAPAPSVTPLDTAALSPVALKRSVYVPAGPVIARLVKLAAPEAPVVAVRVPPRVAPEGPEASAAVTTMPDWATGFPDASRSWSTGCGANATPLVELAGGCVVMVSCDAAPAPIVMPLETASVKPVAVKRSV